MGSPNYPATLESHAKSLFKSKTFWGAIATFWLAILPDLKGLATELQAEQLNHLIHIVTVLTSTAVTIYGRYVASIEVYTPGWMPGRNEPKEQPIQSEES